MKTIYLDMDGVIVDFISSALQLFDVNYDDVLAHAIQHNQLPLPFKLDGILNNYFQYNDEQFNYTIDDVWKRIDNTNHFWENLKPYPWFHQLFDGIERLCVAHNISTNEGNHSLPSSQLMILSSPSLSPSCLYGKTQWLQQHVSQHYRNFVFTPHKHLLAQPPTQAPNASSFFVTPSSTLLIDDSDTHIDRFCECGGQAIQFPQPWNQTYQEIEHLRYTPNTSTIEETLTRVEQFLT